MSQAQHHHEVMRELEEQETTSSKKTCADKQSSSDYIRWRGVQLNYANCYERGFMFDDITRRFK